MANTATQYIKTFHHITDVREIEPSPVATHSILTLDNGAIYAAENADIAEAMFATWRADDR